MMINMLSFEWRYFIRQPSFIVTSLIFFILPFLSVTVEGVQLSGGGNVNINSPFATAQTLLIMGFFGMFLVVNFVANTALRNDSVHMSEILYTKPIKSFSYQLGRFLGSYLVVCSVLFMVPLGLAIGSLMPWLDAERLGAFNLSAYLAPYFLFSVPTAFILSTLFYAAALRFRSMMAVYLIALGMFVVYVASGAIFSDPQQRDMLAISDPFGIRSFSDFTRYWTPSQKNTDIVGLVGNVLLNRTLWLGLGLFMLFSLGKLFSPLRLASIHDKNKAGSKSYELPLDNDIGYKYRKGADFKQFTTRVTFEIKQVIMSPGFIVLLLIGALLVVTEFIDPAGIYGASNWPLTQYMVELVQDAFSLSLVIVITFYTAEVVWRERSTGIGDIVESMPVQNFIFWLSKLIAVCLVILILLVVGVVATISNQLGKGFVDIDLLQYLISIFYFTALYWMLLVVLAFFIQVLSPNKYVGMLIFVGYFFVSLAFNQVGIEHNMFIYGASPSMEYSDMNGYGWAMQTQHFYMLYWGSLALVLSAFSYALWQRGPEVSVKLRMVNLGYGLGKRGQAAVVVGFVSFISLGTVIYHNTTVINQYMTSDEFKNVRSDYEKTFAKNAEDPITTVTAVNIDAAIFPELRKIEAIATLTLQNKTNETIEKFLINYPEYSTIEIEGAEISEYNRAFRAAWMSFDKPLMPRDNIDIKIKITRQHRGFKDKGEDSSLVKNGTFINNFALLPTFGVNKAYFLDDQHDRRKRNLPPPQRAYKLEDESRYNESFFGKHVGMIDFKATLSTSEHQTAIAPGYLTSSWSEGKRNYFVYEMDAPMINFYAILSAELALKKVVHKGIDIAVYYHKDHAWNVDRMIESTRDSIDHFTAVFGPYQHKQLRIIEFPGYNKFAQSFANTVPYSEKIGFISDLRDANEIDPVYYITAHEVAHQWFGHQLEPANVQGSAILAETLSQYAALQVMQKEYGEVKIRKFLTYELDSYFRGRSTEYLEEMPLMRAENQQYIHYRKGSVVMMAIADRIGFTALNLALKRLIDEYKFSEGRRATTLDLLAAIKQVSELADHAFIEQQFAEITLYDLRLKEASWKKEDSQMMLTVDVSRYIADGEGNETKAIFNDWVDIVVFSDDPNNFSAENHILYRQKHLVKDGENELILNIDLAKNPKFTPAFVGVDPFIRYIDRDNKDNIVKL
jgi:ABC-2 type transport system permease protein